MRSILAAAALSLLAGCYPVTIDTGLAPTGGTYRTQADTFLFGTLPMGEVQTARRCPHGVARTTTQIGPTELLYAFITVGLFIPVEVEVTCAG